jgi:hypothetical protein
MDRFDRTDEPPMAPENGVAPGTVAAEDLDGTAPTQAVPRGYEIHQSYPGATAADRAAEIAHNAAALSRTPETKEFFRTSEFAVWMVVAIGILVAAALTAHFGAGRAWTLVTVLSAAYIVSRGISKAGTSRGREDRVEPY